ncbi:adhesin-like protein [Methanobrevibacter olleyae]|uniref:Adhesin-like protein n=1 Tax=Methanobrevibacter olleyae TaxID=294671 RepID=A0A126QY50_METOL|nr:adhesin-like protein [Methanobrevibacter olleyae]
MRLNYKKISIMFSLLFILLISLAMVSAEEISSDSADLNSLDDSECINEGNDNNLNLEYTESDSEEYIDSDSELSHSESSSDDYANEESGDIISSSSESELNEAVPYNSGSNALEGSNINDSSFDGSTTVLTRNILGKMGKKVILVANVYDAYGLRVNGGTVTFTVKGKNYRVNVKNGIALKVITSPFVGIYKVKVKYDGVGAYKSSSSSFILLSDLRIKYLYYKTLAVKKGAKKYYKMSLTNYYTNKPLKKFKVKFKVKINKKNWKTYILKSNSKGIIKWSTKKLSVGTHIVKISSPYKLFKFNLKGKIVVFRR